MGNHIDAHGNGPNTARDFRFDLHFYFRHPFDLNGIAGIYCFCLWHNLLWVIHFYFHHTVAVAIAPLAAAGHIARLYAGMVGLASSIGDNGFTGLLNFFNGPTNTMSFSINLRDAAAPGGAYARPLEIATAPPAHGRKRNGLGPLGTIPLRASL